VEVFSSARVYIVSGRVRLTHTGTDYLSNISPTNTTGWVTLTNKIDTNAVRSNGLVVYSYGASAEFYVDKVQLEYVQNTDFEDYQLIPDLKPSPPKRAIKYNGQDGYSFSRPSVETYNGITVPMDTPRVDANGVIVEEGTTNLVPSFKSGSWSLDSHVVVNSSSNITLNATATSQYSSVTFTVSASTTYTLTCKHNGLMYIRQFNGGSVINNSGYFPDQSRTFTTLSNCTAITLFLSNDTLGVGTYTFEKVQLEQKSYPTTFTDNPLGRQAETLTFPTANIVSQSQGTVEGWIKPAPIPTGTSEVWWSIASGDGAAWIGVRSDGGNVGCVDTGSYIPLTDRSKHIHIAQSWTGNTFKTYINGVLIGTGTRTTTPPSTAYIGTFTNGGFKGNMTTKSLRISNVARTDQEIAESYRSSQITNHLKFDDSTTKLLNF
jgi:hypothetical protein